MKQEFFHTVAMSLLLYHFATWKKKFRWELHNDAACFLEQILEAAFQKTAAVQPLTSHHKPSEEEQVMLSKDKLLKCGI